MKLDRTSLSCKKKKKKSLLLALICATAQQNYCHGAGTRPLNPFKFSETVKQINTQFGGMTPIHHIFRPF